MTALERAFVAGFLVGAGLLFGLTVLFILARPL